MAFIQSIGMAQFNNYLGGKLIIHQSIMSYLLIAVVLTAGTALIWLGDQITQFELGKYFYHYLWYFINFAFINYSIRATSIRW